MNCYIRPQIFGDSMERAFYIVVDLRANYEATQPEGVREQDADENVRI
jgi:hypothetical protein